MFSIFLILIFNGYMLGPSICVMRFAFSQTLLEIFSPLYNLRLNQLRILRLHHLIWNHVRRYTRDELFLVVVGVLKIPCQLCVIFPSVYVT